MSNSREALIAATPILKALKARGLDQFVLSLGLPDPDIGRSGTLDQRVSSLRQFALSRPQACTPDGRLIGRAIVERAEALIQSYDGRPAPNVTGTERQDFFDALLRSRTGEREALTESSTGALSDTAVIDASSAINGPAKSSSPVTALGRESKIDYATKSIQKWTTLVAAIGALLAAITVGAVNAGGLRDAICNKIGLSWCTTPCTLDRAIKEGCK